jgi:ribonuclease D
MGYRCRSVIRDQAVLDALLPRLAAARRVAVDTEFHTERHFHPRLMLLQLRPDDGEAVLVDPLAGLDLRGLGGALAIPELLVHGGAWDVQILHDLTGLRPNAVFDTQVAAGFVGDGFPVRLQELTRRHIARFLPKTETLSDWSRRPLSPQQVEYALDDVRVLGPLADALLAELRARGNEEVARECMRDFYERALLPPNDQTAWQKIPGAHLLDDPERAVLQSLTAWRDARARDLDVPRQNVLSDALLLDLARRRPTNVEAMRANRRMPSQATRRDAAEILECVAMGLDAPPPPALRARPAVWTDLVRAAARVAETKSGVAPELLLDEDTLSRLFSGAPIENWRRSALGDEFLAFLGCKSSMALPGNFLTHDNS